MPVIGGTQQILAEIPRNYVPRCDVPRKIQVRERCRYFTWALCS